MRAIVLSYDPHIQFARLVVSCYAELWHECPLTFRIPYNHVLPSLSAPHVELVQTPSDIGSTVSALLEGIANDEFVFWAIDDRYPLRIVDLRVLDAVVDLASKSDVDACEIKLTNHGMAHCSVKAIAEVEGMRFYRQVSEPALGFYMHHLVRAGVLRQLFQDRDLPDLYSIRQFHSVLLRRETYEGIWMPEVSLIYFGETMRDGKMTRNGYGELHRHGLSVPNIGRLDEVVAYGTHGERLSRLSYEYIRFIERLGVRRG